ncbi:MAG TPA: NAD-dependent epimerase/dehydratase family protein [Chitinophagaceae bacterium]
MKKAIVFGAGGFIGSHLVRRLKNEGYWVKGADLKHPSFMKSYADKFVIADLRKREEVEALIDQDADELYQLAADMGGAGYLFTGENDANVMHGSALINLHTAEVSRLKKVKHLFFSSSACVYPKHNQSESENPCCSEDSVYPADPDSEYGWEKLFSERLYQSYHRNYALNIKIARFHNVYGPGNPWCGGKEKAPAAICRKIAEAEEGGQIEIWGNGEQTRSFLYIDDCIDGIRMLMKSDYQRPVNIGSEESVTINYLAERVMKMFGKKLSVRHINGPVGVQGRNSDNSLMNSITGWEPVVSLDEGIRQTYLWISDQLNKTQAEPSFSASEIHSIVHT